MLGQGGIAGYCSGSIKGGDFLIDKKLSASQEDSFHCGLSNSFTKQVKQRHFLRQLLCFSSIMSHSL
jgi:hypothetical protein